MATDKGGELFLGGGCSKGFCSSLICALSIPRGDGVHAGANDESAGDSENAGLVFNPESFCLD